MSVRHALLSLWYGGTMRVASSRLGSLILARTLHHVDRPLLRWSGGRYSLLAAVSGLPAVTLTTTGAKSGQARSVPLVGFTIGEDVVLIASNYGRASHPAWYHNLRAHPEATLALRGRVGRYIAREVTPQEREVYWQRAVNLYPGYAAYAERTGGRRIAVFVLHPQLAGS